MNWNLREGIKQAILANSVIAAIVGTNVSATFAPAATPADGTWIVFTKIAGGEVGAMDGDGGLTHPVFQFTIGGNDKEKVDTVQQLLTDFNCTEFTYNSGSVSVPSNHVLTFIYRDDRDGWEEGSRVYKAAVDLEVWAYKN